jgi:hypothetical protein
MASFFWTACLATNIFVTIVYRNPEFTQKFFPVYHILSWGGPLASVLMLLRWNAFDRSEDDNPDLWCWVKPGKAIGGYPWMVPSCPKLLAQNHLRDMRECD